MEIEKLKPCPFCLGMAVLGSNDRGHWAGCVNSECFVQTRAFYTEEEAVKAWNTRADDENPPLTLDELKEMNCQPIWIKNTNSEIGLDGWAIFRTMHIKQIAHCLCEANISYYMKDYGETWLAYKRKPEAQE